MLPLQQGRSYAIRVKDQNKKESPLCQQERQATAQQRKGRRHRMIEDNPDDEQIDLNFIRHLNGFVSSVKDNEDLIDLNFFWGSEGPLLDPLITVATQLMKCHLYVKRL